MSEEVKEAKKSVLIAKISKIQGQIGGALTVDESNTYHQSRFTSLSKIMKELIPKLSAEGIALMHEVRAENNGLLLNIITRLVTVDGESVEISIPMTVTNPNPQAIGSLVAYGRRYGVNALFAIAQEDDDDGEGAMNRTNSSTSKKPAEEKTRSQPQSADNTVKWLDKERVEKFLKLLETATNDSIENAGKYMKDRKAYIKDDDYKTMTEAYNSRRQTLGLQ